MISCTPTRPQVHFRGEFSGSLERVVYLVAARQKEQIAHSLRQARITVTDDLLAAPFYLRATVGNDKGFRKCGTFNNVKFSLRRSGQEVLLVSASGWSGTCDPNVFDEMSKTLRAAFRGGG
jgi:hypothetical protein